MIARTESARALDQGNVQVYKNLGVQLCDVIGCEDESIMAGQTYGCNSTNIPLEEAELIEFHPNHKGAIVPQITKSKMEVRALTQIPKIWHNRGRVLQGVGGTNES